MHNHQDIMYSRLKTPHMHRIKTTIKTACAGYKTYEQPKRHHTCTTIKTSCTHHARHMHKTCTVGRAAKGKINVVYRLGPNPVTVGKLFALLECARSPNRTQITATPCIVVSLCCPNFPEECNTICPNRTNQISQRWNEQILLQPT